MSDNLNSRTLISASAARRKIGNPSRTTFWRICNDEKLNFPKPVRVRGRVLFDEAEINQFIEGQLRERDDPFSLELVDITLRGDVARVVKGEAIKLGKSASAIAEKELSAIYGV